MHSQCRDIGPEWSQILPYLVTLLLHTENWKQNFTKRGKNQWNFNYSPVHSGTMVNHKMHTQVCSNAFWTCLPVVILMFKIVWCCYFLLFSNSFQLLHSVRTVALMGSLFLQPVLIEPVFPEQVLWLEPDLETQTESQYSRFDSQISKLAKEKKNKKE